MKHEYAGSPELIETRSQKNDVSQPKKLRLEKAVIRSLTEQELGAVAGGNGGNSGRDCTRTTW